MKIKCPAKINLTLKVGKINLKSGFHPIESIMQTVSLFDYLTVTKGNGINLSGNSNEITYDSDNLILKAANAYFERAKIKNPGINIYLEKNIPVAAGLAGGSADAAGVLFALDKIYGAISADEIFDICAKLGSDINFCYKGGCALAKGKGDNLKRLPFEEFDLTIIKPSGLKISTKTAYDAFDKLNMPSNLPNDLEFAVGSLYPKLKELGHLGFQMSGSGPSFFIKKTALPSDFNRSGFEIFENLKAVPYGVCLDG